MTSPDYHKDLLEHISSSPVVTLADVARKIDLTQYSLLDMLERLETLEVIVAASEEYNDD